ncbi:DegT/DnrJ/EryC1/StrS family aminotransferase [Thermodesulfobacteriota bacterium]
MELGLGGFAIEIERVRKILPEHIVIIEDAAHALGAKFLDGTPVGSSGNMTCFSFYANKNLSTVEGGAIALFDEKIADRLRSLRQNGMSVDAWKRFSQPKSILSPEVVELGYKMNYTDLQASIGRVQLRRQPEFHNSRLDIAKTYHENLYKFSSEIKFQSKIIHPSHARHLFLIQLSIENSKLTRDEVLLKLRKRNIGASIHYPPLHLMPFYLGKEEANLPNTVRICSRIMTLPISSSMTLDDAEYVIFHLKKCLE